MPMLSDAPALDYPATLDSREPTPDDPLQTFPTETDRQWLLGFARGLESDYMGWSEYPVGTPEAEAFEDGLGEGLLSRPHRQDRRREIAQAGRDAGHGCAPRIVAEDLTWAAERRVWLAAYEAAALEQENLEWLAAEHEALEAMMGAGR